MSRFDELDLGPNDHHHLHPDSDQSLDTIGRSRLKTRLFHSRASSDSNHPAFKFDHTSGNEFGQTEEVSSSHRERQENENDTEKYHREKALRQKMQKSAFEARDKILELGSKLRTAECDAQMWKEAAEFEREAKEKAEQEKTMAAVAKVEVETKVKIAQIRIMQLETERQTLQDRVSELSTDLEARDNQLKALSESSSKQRHEIAKVATDLQKKALELKSKDEQLTALQESLRLVQSSCREAEEKHKESSGKLNQLDILCDRNAVRMRSLESSVSTYAAK